MREHLLTFVDAVFLLVVGFLLLAVPVVVGFLFGPIVLVVAGIITVPALGPFFRGLVRVAAALHNRTARLLAVAP